MSTTPSIADLDYLDEEFGEVEEAAGFTRIPDGDYIAQVEAARAEVRDQDQTPQLAWELTIVGGDYDGRKLFRNNVLRDNQALGYLKKDLRNCGIDIHAPGFKLSEFLVNGTEELLDLCVEVTVKNKKYTNRDGVEKEAANVYINGLAPDVDAEGEDGEVHSGEVTDAELAAAGDPDYDNVDCSGVKDGSRRPAQTSSRRPAPAQQRSAVRAGTTGTKKANPFKD